MPPPPPKAGAARESKAGGKGGEPAVPPKLGSIRAALASAGPPASTAVSMQDGPPLLPIPRARGTVGEAMAARDLPVERARGSVGEQTAAEQATVSAPPPKKAKAPPPGALTLSAEIVAVSQVWLGGAGTYAVPGPPEESPGRYATEGILTSRGSPSQLPGGSPATALGV